jgi:putative flippase GtrA
VAQLAQSFDRHVVGMSSAHVPHRLRARIARLLRYGTVSAVATATGLTVLGVLVSMGMSPGWANVVATAVGTVPSFELNRRWVWSVGGPPSIRRQVVPFVVMCFLELLGSTLAVHLAAVWASSEGLRGWRRTAVVEVANVVAFGSFWVAQYLLLDKVLFRASATGSGARRGAEALTE